MDEGIKTAGHTPVAWLSDHGKELLKMASLANPMLAIVQATEDAEYSTPLYAHPPSNSHEETEGTKPTRFELSEARTVDGKLMIVGGEGLDFGLIAECSDKKHAAFIVKACNSHEELVEALRALVIESGGKAIPNSSLTVARNKALAALSKVEGRS